MRDSPPRAELKVLKLNDGNHMKSGTPSSLKSLKSEPDGGADEQRSDSDRRLDEQLRRLYEYILDEPIPQRLLDAVKKGQSKDSS